MPGWYGSAPEIELTTGTAVWCHSGKPVVPLRWVLVRDPAVRLDQQALSSTDASFTPLTVAQFFVRRWPAALWAGEVTFEEARRQLGLETQRQWSDRAIARTTPVLLSLFSLVTLCATWLGLRVLARASAWYAKGVPTFSDALTSVRGELWRYRLFPTSWRLPDKRQRPPRIYRRLIEPILYAA